MNTTTKLQSVVAATQNKFPTDATAIVHRRVERVEVIHKRSPCCRSVFCSHSHDRCAVLIRLSRVNLYRNVPTATARRRRRENLKRIVTVPFPFHRIRSQQHLFVKWPLSRVQYATPQYYSIGSNLLLSNTHTMEIICVLLSIARSSLDCDARSVFLLYSALRLRFPEYRPTSSTTFLVFRYSEGWS